MTGRFNQDLPENLQTAFKKATNFEPRIITKQSINNRKAHEVNHIDITHGEDEVEINEINDHQDCIKSPQYWKPRLWIQPKQPTAETSKCICHTTWTGQQGTAVQDPGGTTTSVTVQR